MRLPIVPLLIAVGLAIACRDGHSADLTRSNIDHVCCAVIRYQKAHGSAPASIGDLVPPACAPDCLLERLPLDARGVPLRLESQGPGKVTIWSGQRSDGGGIGARCATEYTSSKVTNCAKWR